MAGKYYQYVSGVKKDLTELCEGKVHDVAPFSDKFTGEAFQKAGTNTENITIDGYKYNNGTAITYATAVKKGCYPTFSKLMWSSATSGTYSITRTASTLTIGSTTLYATNFSCGIIPEELIIVLVGGGGGGGGSGYFSPGKNKSGYVSITGGAGGGGAVAAARIKLPLNTEYTLTVGAGGAKGSNGSSSSKSSGGNGVGGGASSITPKTGTGLSITAPGGKGGKGGVGGEDTGTAGKGGAGGNCGTISTTTYIRAVVTAKGGGGNYLNSHTNTSFAGLSFNPYTGTGSTSTEVCPARELDNPQANYNYSTTTSDSSYFSGGCSHGRGYPFGSSYGNDGYGGGGGAGQYRGPGYNGYIAIYY